MGNKDDINNFLESNGFKLTDRDESEYLGDYYCTYSNDLIKLRFVSDKSFKSIDIKNTEDKESWYDLALLKALLYQEQKLNIVTSIQELINFLKKELKQINQLFNNENYNSTKNKLDDLRNKRAKQMFPKIIK